MQEWVLTGKISHMMPGQVPGESLLYWEGFVALVPFSPASNGRKTKRAGNCRMTAHR